MGLKRPTGALVASVMRERPGGACRPEAGDVIVSVDKQAVDDPNAFDYRFATKPLGGTAELGVLRAGRETTVRSRCTARPMCRATRSPSDTRSPFSGAKVANLSPALADELQVQDADEGVVILDVDAGSYASNLGFRRGDVIEVGERRENRQDPRPGARHRAMPSRSWRIVIRRGGKQISAVFNG